MNGPSSLRDPNAARMSRLWPPQKEDSPAVKQTVKTTTTTTTTTTGETKLKALNERLAEAEEVAIVQDLGQQVDWSATQGPIRRNSSAKSREPLGVDGNKLVSTLGTIAAQSSATRIVVCLLKDGEKLQLKIQEMRPSVFDVGANSREAQKYLEEHQKIMKNLDNQRQAPLESWMWKYKKIQDDQERKLGREMSAEMKLVFMCMAENLQGCWRALWWQLELRLQLLKEACNFFNACEKLFRSLDKADLHVQNYRKEFLDGPGSLSFSQAADELNRLNNQIQQEYLVARGRQKQLVELIDQLSNGNLQDARQNHLNQDGQNLINFISSYLEPFERRKIQLENVIKTTKSVTTTSQFVVANQDQQQQQQQPDGLIKKTRVRRNSKISTANGQIAKTNPTSSAATKTGTKTATATTTASTSTSTSTSSSSSTTTATNRTPLIREISSFNDLDLANDWLQIKTDQLNSSLLSSLGVDILDSRSILNKHEQIALECSAIEEATLNFNGKNIHALKVAPQGLGSAETMPTAAQAGQAKGSTLFDRQKALAEKVRDVTTILDARIALLRRTIDFYGRAKEATSDINKWLRRLQVDNSLQSVQFVTNELELKDVSAVVASGATILSELQQLQLAQQHGQRSKIVNLNLITNGIRSVIDQLNQDLAHLKTVLNQRRLVLLNEDAGKMADNFSNKCHQLQFWLDQHPKATLQSNSRVGFEPRLVRQFVTTLEEPRLAVQNKTPEVEALLRLLSTLSENFDAKNATHEEIQRDTDELRQDWISVTNCLDRRIELGKRFLQILVAANGISKHLDALQGTLAKASLRDDPDLRAKIEQSLLQLEQQVKNFTQDAQKTDTSLVYPAGLETKAPVNDINKQQVVAHANGSLKLLQERLRSAHNKLSAQGRAPVPGPAQCLGPWSPTFSSRPSSSSSSSLNKPDRVSLRDAVAPKTVGRVAAIEPSLMGLAAKNLAGPRFVRSLKDQLVEPFSTIKLECETDPETSAGCRLEWFLNGNKRIPSSMKHTILNDGHKHKLVISQFNPTCCGSYTARATNLETGQSTSTSCRLSLAGIKEVDNSDSDSLQAASEQTYGPGARPMNEIVSNGCQVPKRTWQQQQRQMTAGESPAASSTSSFSNWTSNIGPPPLAGEQNNAGQKRSLATSSNNKRQAPAFAMDRIIQGVGSPASLDGQTPERMVPSEQSSRLFASGGGGEGASAMRTSQTETQKASTIIETSTSLVGQRMPVVHTSYRGPRAKETLNGRNTNNNNNRLLQVNDNNNNDTNQNYHVESPAGSTTTTITTTNRSVSRSPFEGTPQPPRVLQNLTESLRDSSSGSRAGLVCVVVGNPPPTIEWLHNNQPIAQAKCPRSATASNPSHANICKLTIQTMSDKTQGQYTLRATNRLGQTSTALALNK